METSERMMIVGLALQGLLANTLWVKRYTTDTRMIPNPQADEIGQPEEIEETFTRLMTPDELEHQRVRAYKEALLIADLLDPRPVKVAAEAITYITRAAMKALAAIDITPDEDWIFERVSRWYADSTGVPEGTDDRLIRALVRALKAE